MKYKNIREEELKNKVGADWFKNFDTTEIIGNIDFSVFAKQNELFERTPLLWAEAKTGNFDVVTMFVQLILTIGKARTFDKTMPPAFLGAFDFKKIAFVPYIAVQDIFYLNDFNWNVTPSNHETKEFLLIKERIEATLKQNTFVFDYQKDEKDLEFFIKNNIAKSTSTSKLKIDKNNFIPIYLRWLEIVKPQIDTPWDDLKKANILDSDFFLADLFVDDKDTQQLEDDSSIRDNLFVVYQNQGYKIAKENIKQMFDATIGLKNKDTYLQFWKRYKRPPIKEFQEYIIERRDLLVPQDIRERKGAFFTPRIWVELSQKYLTDYLGENWQDDYYVWDCAAGTGNLLAGLTNRYNIFASTLDQADVNVIHERIDHGANLLKGNVFQFDFLNDDFVPISKGGKMPDSLCDIISSKEKRKKLVVYINPPYAEATNLENYVISSNKKNVSFTKIRTLYSAKLKNAIKELFVQFLTRIYFELDGSIIAEFSTLKAISSNNFIDFRNLYKSDIETGFIVPAKTFDNVKGQFPIGFKIWNPNIIRSKNQFEFDVYNEKGEFIGIKNVFSYDKSKYINDWIKKFKFSKEGLALIEFVGNDFQHQNFVSIEHFNKPIIGNNVVIFINHDNIIPISIYFSVRKVIKSNWLNDRDQFLYPDDGWQNDLAFQSDCLAYVLFNNNIQSQYGTNHWIPFTEYEVNAQAKFESHFMTDFIKGKIGPEASGYTLFEQGKTQERKPLHFSEEATAVFDAGRELWKYYHAQPSSNSGFSGESKPYNVNASLYDIRAYFQGRNPQGRMNPKSDDPTYTALISELRNKLSILAEKIQPKVYEYGFLKM